MDESKLWIALVVKTTSFATGVGFESLAGIVVNANEPTRIWGLRSEVGIRVGLGLGAGVQAVLMVFVNVDDPQNETLGADGFDPSVDLGVGPERISSSWIGVFRRLNQFVASQPSMIRSVLRRIRSNGRRDDVGDFIRIVQLCKENVLANQAGFSAGEKMVFSFDIPLAGQSLIAAITLVTTRARLDRFSLASEQPILPPRGTIHFARGFVDALFDLVGTAAASPMSLLPEERNRYSEGINEFVRLNRPNWRDHQGRTLKQHILHNYFRDNPDRQRETRDERIDKRELAGRIAESMDHHLGLSVDYAYYPY